MPGCSLTSTVGRPGATNISTATLRTSAMVAAISRARAATASVTCAGARDTFNVVAVLVLGDVVGHHLAVGAARRSR